MRRWLGLSILVILIGSVFAGPVAAQGTSGSAGSGVGWDGWGIRVGGSTDPDQIYGGVHFELGHFAKDVRFRPTVEIGFGDDATLFQAMAEAHYVFSKLQVWKPYVGGGLGLTWIDLDDVAPGEDDSETDLALMGIAGIESKLRSGTRLFFELKFGLGDEDPDLKLAVGWGWK